MAEPPAGRAATRPPHESGPGPGHWGTDLPGVRQLDSAGHERRWLHPHRPRHRRRRRRSALALTIGLALAVLAVVLWWGGDDAGRGEAPPAAAPQETLPAETVPAAPPPPAPGPATPALGAVIPAGSGTSHVAVTPDGRTA